MAGLPRSRRLRDAMAIIEPPPRRFIGSTQYFIASQTPMTLVWSTCSKSSRLRVSIGLNFPSVPAFQRDSTTKGFDGRRDRCCRPCLIGGIGNEVGESCVNAETVAGLASLSAERRRA